VVYGFDGGKKVKGRKRHIIVDSQGFLMGVLVTEANASERLGAIVVLEEVKEKLSRLEVIWVDQGYSGKKFADAVKHVCGESVRVEVISRISKGFETLPKRWIRPLALIKTLTLNPSPDFGEGLDHPPRDRRNPAVLAPLHPPWEKGLGDEGNELIRARGLLSSGRLAG